MKEFTVTETKDNQKWDDFLLKSINKNVYCHSFFLDNLKNKYKKYFIKKKDEIFASFFLNVNKKNILVSDEIIYTPLSYKHFPNKPLASIVNEKFELNKVYLDFIITNFKKIELISDYHLDDLRPFYWHNYEKKKKIFKIKEIKYTSVIDLKKLDTKNFEECDFYKNLSVRIRQQYNLAKKKKNYLIDKKFEKNFFTEIIKKTFKRQKKKIDFDHNLQLKILEKLEKKGNIKMYTVFENEKILSFALFGILADHAIYLHGGRATEELNDYSLSFTLIEAFKDLRINGVKSLDLEGINSPKRGFNKIGYGGKLKPYYIITNH